MRLSSGGFLGLNETSPTSKLEITDTTVGTTPTDNDNLFIKLSNKSVTAAGETWGIGFNSNNLGTDKLGAFVSAFGHYSTNYNTSLIFGTRDTSGNASERMRVTSAGNLLIGTTSDGGQKLQVDGTAIINDNLFINKSSDGSIVFRTSGVNKFLIGYDSSPDGFRIYNYNTATASLFIAKSTNNVLIGTTTDDASNKLQVAGNIKIKSTSAAQLFLDSASSVDAVLNFQENAVQKAKIGYDSSNSGLAIVTGTGPFSGAAMVVLDNDKVGISTLNPNRNLHVYGQQAISNSDDSGAFLFIPSASDNKIYSRAGNASGTALPLVFINGGNETMRLSSNRNVLIGTTTDGGAYKLDINGKARVQSVLHLDDVLTLSAISTPADPTDGTSSIYMDSADGNIKVKINVGGTVVTRTIATFE